MTYQMKFGKIFLAIKVSTKPQIWGGSKEWQRVKSDNIS